MNLNYLNKFVFPKIGLIQMIDPFKIRLKWDKGMIVNSMEILNQRSKSAVSNSGVSGSLLNFGEHGSEDP